MDDSMSDDGEADAQLRSDLAALGWPELFAALKFSRQQHADLRRIAADIVRARRNAATRKDRE